MITNISIVRVFVKDIDEPKRFYVDVLGFEEKDDITIGDGDRWCTVVHPSQPELQVSLAIPRSAVSGRARLGPAQLHGGRVPRQLRKLDRSRAGVRPEGRGRRRRLRSASAFSGR